MPRAAVASIDQARVTGGYVSGLVQQSVASFKGIPFAAPPIGALRWKAPQPVRAWRGMQKMDGFAPACAQPSYGGQNPSREDCLYLNVWTAAQSSKERRPVMVWIHGGSLNGGATSAAEFDGTRLAQHGVILVSTAYRLGPFGFLAHPELSRESGRGSGAYGLQDLIAALKWVRENIAQFGGDPARVTIFGESAGGIAVSLLAGSPEARGLYQRAISQSGGVFTPPRMIDDTAGGGPLQSLPYAESIGQEFLKGLGAQHIRAARAIPTDKIVEALGGDSLKFWAVIDGKVLQGPNIELYAQGRFNDTPLLVGFNSADDSGKPPNATSATFEAQSQGPECRPQTAAIMLAYPHETDALAAQAFEALDRDAGYGWNTWTWARMQSLRGRSPVYLYYFDVRTGEWPEGAPHGADVSYVFGNFQATTDAKDLAASQLMQAYWINFAMHGDPNGDGLPVWPAFRDTTQQAMVFDEASSAHPLPDAAGLKAVDAYFQCHREKTHAASTSTQ
jgi:para-nitrobenzyl esterase